MIYKVEVRGQADYGSHYIIGLKFDPWSDGSHSSPDTLLVYHYPGGDVDTRMRSARMMLAALYDIYQTNDALKEGDLFETEFGDYVCQGVHVMPLFQLPPEHDEPRWDDLFTIG